MSVQTGAELFQSMTGYDLGSNPASAEESTRALRQARQSHDAYSIASNKKKAGEWSARAHFLVRLADAHTQRKTLGKTSFERDDKSGNPQFLTIGTKEELTASLNVAQSRVDANFKEGDTAWQRLGYEKAHFQRATLAHSLGLTSGAEGV